MSINKWVYEKATGKWMVGFRDPAVFLGDAVNYGLADFGTDTTAPDPILERFDAVLLRRAATPAEVADSQNDQLTTQILQSLDGERLISAVVWVVIDTFAPPATIGKYQTARTKIIAAYKAKPWV
jgi:hypothetical protein